MKIITDLKRTTISKIWFRQDKLNFSSSTGPTDPAFTKFEFFN